VTEKLSGRQNGQHAVGHISTRKDSHGTHRSHHPDYRRLCRHWPRFCAQVSRTRKSSHRDRSPGSALNELKAKYPKLHTIQSDVADPAQIAVLAKRVKAGYPRLDVLMNNAGIMLYKNLKVPAADLDALMAEVNINVGG